MQALLRQQGLAKFLDGEMPSTSTEEMKNLKKNHDAIFFYLYQMEF
jgi:hypothetical protein